MSLLNACIWPALIPGTLARGLFSPSEITLGWMAGQGLDEIDPYIRNVLHMETGEAVAHSDQISSDWNDLGYFKLPGQLTTEQQEEIRSEAESLASEAVRRGVADIEVRRDGSFASPSKFAVYTGGPALERFHRDMGLLATLREMTSNPRLIPVRCGYNYYAAGDYMGVHRDEVRATVTVTFPVTEQMPPTYYAANGRTWDDAELTEFVSTAGTLPANGELMTLEPGVLNVFDGYNIPHWRPEVDEPHILANLVYFRL